MTPSEFAILAIERLGGTLEVATLLGMSEQRVSNWKRRGLPPEAYDALKPKLRRKGVDPNPLMFGQYPIAKSTRGLRRVTKGNGK